MNIAMKETLHVIINGCVPAFIVQHKEGLEKLKSFASGAIVPDYLFYYFLCFFLLHLTLTIFLWLYGYKFSPDTQRYAKQKIRYIGEIGDSMLNIYRLVSGLLLAIPLIWKMTEPNTLTNMQLIGLTSFSLLFLAGVISISNANAWAKRL